MASKKNDRPEKAAEETCDFLACSSIPLREIGPDQFPIAVASGCLIDYGGRRWILTVSHATGNMGDWIIEVEYEEGRGLKQYRIGAMNFLKLGNFSSGTLEDLDLAYAEVAGDLQPFWQPRNEQAQIVTTLPRTIFRSDLRHQPSTVRSYGFAGGVKATEEHHFGMRWHGTEFVCYTGLDFEGEDQQFYFFKLPFAHPGHEFFKGTSGAPICDAERNIVALVCGPGNAPDTIRGIKMQFFRSALDVQLLESTQGIAEDPEAPD